MFFVSRKLSKAEKKYPILHREALAIVFSMEKFYKYVLGQKVCIVTDHKPLIGIFKGKKGGPTVVANRLQRYFLRLSIFDFTITYKPGKDNHVADCLSRLPLDQELSSSDLEESHRSSLTGLNYLVEKKKITLNAEIISNHSLKDPLISTVIEFVQKGWPRKVTEKPLRKFYAKRYQLGMDSGCLVLGDRTVIPSALKTSALKMLHANHRGIHKMKQLARMYLYWNGIDTDIENWTRACKQCQLLGINRTPRIYGNWPVTTQPFERVHIDFFHKNNQTYLILVDAYSRWLEIRKMNKTTATNVSQESQYLDLQKPL